MNILGLIYINDWLLLVILILALVYWLGTNTFGVFESRGVPGPKPWPFIGNAGELNRSGMEGHDMKVMKKYGKIVGSYQGKMPVLLVADPDLIRQVFVKDTHIFTNRFVFDFGVDIFMKAVSVLKGEDWKRTRSILTPTFSTGKMRKMFYLLNKSIAVMVTNLNERARKKEPFSAKEVFGTLTVDIIANTMFGMDVDAQNNPNSRFVEYISQAFGSSGWKAKASLSIFLYAPWLSKAAKKLFGIAFTPDHIIDYFVDTTKQVLAERRKDGAQTYNDFMALMLKAHVDDDVDKEDEHLHDALGDVARVKKAGLTDEEILAQALIFYFAGYETTATLMSWMAYCLATNQACQETLYREIADKLGDGELDYDKLNSLDYLEQVMWETLRMHPPALRFDREASEDFEIAGYHLPAGVDIQVPVYYMHYSDEYWKEPFKFDPTRFSADEKAKRNPYVYNPFGQGPRNCIGMRFAIMEAKAAICQLVNNFRVNLAPGMEPHLDPLDTTQKWKRMGFHFPDDGIHLTVSPRV